MGVKQKKPRQQLPGLAIGLRVMGLDLDGDRARRKNLLVSIGWRTRSEDASILMKNDLSRSAGTGFSYPRRAPGVFAGG